MANRKRKCPFCKEFAVAVDMLIINNRAFCNYDHASKYAAKNRPTGHKKKKAHEKRELKARKKALKPRTALYNKLGAVVNQWVVHVRDKGKPCYTCGTTNPYIKYDAGHFHTRKARSDIRFELMNIAKQCSRECNQYGSGMRLEFEKNIARDHGQLMVEWLKIRKPPLDQQFPTTECIEEEIKRFKFLIRKAGLTPRTK